MSKEYSFQESLVKFFNNELSNRQIIGKLKSQFKDDVFKSTEFLNSFEPSFDERIYYIIHNLKEPQLCPFCQKNLRTFYRMNQDLRPTCNDKACISQTLKNKHLNNDSVSKNRNKSFAEWQENLNVINDDIIKEGFFINGSSLKRGTVENITNEKLLDYLKTRYNDSNSIEETVRRIRLGIEEKPKCPTCGKPVNFLGKPNHMFTTYCSNKCSANNEETIRKKQISDMRNHDGIMGWTLSNSNPDKIEQRKGTLLEKYGTLNLHAVPEFEEKSRQTSIKKFGYPSVMQNPEKLEEFWEKRKENNVSNGDWTSNIEKELKAKLTELYPDLIWQYMDKKNRYVNPYTKRKFVCDFYIPSKDLFIEYQGFWTHQYHPYNSKDPEDKKQLEKLKEKAFFKKLKNKETGDTHNDYIFCIDTWTNKDPLKRKVVLNNNLNFIEIWPDDSFEEIVNKINSYPNINN